LQIGKLFFGQLEVANTKGEAKHDDIDVQSEVEHHMHMRYVLFFADDIV